MTRGQRIKAARKEVGLTQAQFAKAIGKSFSTVQKYELDIATPPVKMLETIAAVLGITTQSIIPDGSFHIVQTPEQIEYGTLLKKYADGIITAEETQRLFDLQKIQPSATDISNKLSEALTRLGNAVSMLNDDGQQEAAKRVEELTEVPRFQRHMDTEKQK